MYRDGVYNRNHGLDGKDTYQKNKGERLRKDDLGPRVGSSIAKFDSGGLGEDPHGYSIAQDNVGELTERK